MSGTVRYLLSADTLHTVVRSAGMSAHKSPGARIHFLVGMAPGICPALQLQTICFVHITSTSVRMFSFEKKPDLIAGSPGEKRELKLKEMQPLHPSIGKLQCNVFGSNSAFIYTEGSCVFLCIIVTVKYCACLLQGHWLSNWRLRCMSVWYAVRSYELWLQSGAVRAATMSFTSTASKSGPDLLHHKLKVSIWCLIGSMPPPRIILFAWTCFVYFWHTFCKIQMTKWSPWVWRPGLPVVLIFVQR